jgi:hypothetical protein
VSILFTSFNSPNQLRSGLPSVQCCRVPPAPRPTRRRSRRAENHRGAWTSPRYLNQPRCPPLVDARMLTCSFCYSAEKTAANCQNLRGSRCLAADPWGGDDPLRWIAFEPDPNHDAGVKDDIHPRPSASSVARLKGTV